MVKNIAWLAGLLEGDGSFFHKNGVAICPRIAFASLDLDVVEEVALFLKSTITTQKTPKDDKTMYKTAIGKRSIVEPLIKELYPYMSKRRQEQIRLMLAHYNQE